VIVKSCLSVTVIGRLRDATECFVGEYSLLDA